MDLNSARTAELAALPMMEPEWVPEILRRRPFKSWESFKQAFGLDEEFAALWRAHGAVLGVPQRPEWKSARPRQRFHARRGDEASKTTGKSRNSSPTGISP